MTNVKIPAAREQHNISEENPHTQGVRLRPQLQEYSNHQQRNTQIRALYSMIITNRKSHNSIVYCNPFKPEAVWSLVCQPIKRRARLSDLTWLQSADNNILSTQYD